MEQLKIGDELYNKKSSRFSTFTNYKFAKVVRLTSTQAILDNGTRLKNKPEKDYNGLICFPEKGDPWATWAFTTKDVLEKASQEKKRREVISWFEAKKFTEEEMFEIYNLFEINDKIQ